MDSSISRDLLALLWLLLAIWLALAVFLGRIKAFLGGVTLQLLDVLVLKKKNNKLKLDNFPTNVLDQKLLYVVEWEDDRDFLVSVELDGVLGL